MDDEDRGEEGAAAGGWSRRSGEPASQARVRSGPERDRCARRGGRDGRPGTTGAERTQHGRRGIRDPSAALAQSGRSGFTNAGWGRSAWEVRRWRASTWRGPGAVATGYHHRSCLNLFYGLESRCPLGIFVCLWVFGLAPFPLRALH